MVLGQFPCMIFLILPLLCLTKINEYGRNSLTNAEIANVTLQIAEYFSLWTLIIKTSVCLSMHSRLTDELVSYHQGQSAAILKLDDDNSLVFSSHFKRSTSFILIIALFNMIGHHFANHKFLRTFKHQWEQNVRDDFQDSIQRKIKAKKRCCIFNRLFLVRYFNFYEWIGLWKIAGNVIPASSRNIRDQMLWMFYQFSLRYSTLVLFLRYLPLAVSIILIMFGLNTKSIYANYGGEFTSAQRGKDSKYEDYEQFNKDLIDFAVNGTLEVILLGLASSVVTQ